MPRNYPPELLREKYAKLPPGLREAIASVDTANVILETGRSHNLSIDKIGTLADETGFVMSGVSPAGEFIPALAGALGVPAKEAAAIAHEINEKIFLPIREFLKKMHGERWQDELTAGEAGAATQLPPAPIAVQSPPRPAAPPMPPPPQKEDGAASPQPTKKPEPLIIRPLPSPPAKPLPVPAATATLKLQPSPPLSSQPTRQTPSEPPAPIVRPLGVPTDSVRQIAESVPKQPPRPAAPKPVPPAPAAPQLAPKPEPPAPPPPSQAYERAREAFQREIASAAAGQPAAQPETRPVSEASVPPAPLGTKEALQREIEKFRQPIPDGRERAGDAPKPPTAPPTPKPLKLPQGKIPKPPAPEKYTVDPYKEPSE